MREVVFLVRAALVIAFCALPVFSSLRGVMSLTWTLARTEDVFVGTITSNVEELRDGSIELVVRRTLRGGLGVGSSVHATYTTVAGVIAGTPKRYTDNYAGTTGIWFLKPSDSGLNLVFRIQGAIWLKDAYIPASPDPLPAQYSYDESTDIREKLLLEMEAAAMNPLVARAISDVWADLIVDDFGDEPLRRMYGRLATSRDVSVQAKGFAGQLRLGNPAALNAMAAMDPSKVPQNLQALMANGICHFRGKDPAAIAGLATLLNPAFSAQTQRCALYALREIHTRESLPVLAKLLNSSSTDVRYNAMIGVAQYAMSFPVAKVSEKPGMMATYRGDGSDLHSEMAAHYPSTSLFAEHQEEYISYWKAFLAGQGVQ